ncbi:MAG: hypothetical protein JXA69_18995 [Phycisphaerae bacterium]|nr:hypothetical protein [Phycisphaerae bacterium]
MTTLSAIAVTLQIASSASAADRIEPFDGAQRLVTTYYFNWYIDGRTHKRPAGKVNRNSDKDPVRWAWEPQYPTGQEPGAAIFGLDDPATWPRKRLPDTSKWPDSDDFLYHVAELRAMKWVGLDYVLVDLWWPGDFITKDTPTDRTKGRSRRSRIGAPDRELAALFEAWRYLDRRGEKPVKLAVFLATPAFRQADLRGDGGTSDKLLDALWAFYRQFLGENNYPAVMPCRALAAIRDPQGRSRLIVNLFLPRAPGVSDGEWISRWDASTFSTLRARFEGLAGVRLYLSVNQYLHGPEAGGWDGVQADGNVVAISRRAGIVDQEITWHASLAGPCLREDSIAIGCGYFFRHGGHARPGGNLMNPDGSPRYPRAYRFPNEDDAIGSYERQWQAVLNNPASFQKQLLVLESWNELAEGSHLTPARPEVVRTAEGQYVDRWGEAPTLYLELSRKYVALWKGKADTPAVEP